MVNDLDYKAIEFAVSKKDNSRIEKENNIGINVFFYVNVEAQPEIFQSMGCFVGLVGHNQGIFYKMREIFSDFEKRAGEASPHLPPSCAPVMIWFILFTCHIKKLKTVWIYY